MHAIARVQLRGTLQTSEKVEEHQAEETAGELNRNGDHTILIDEPAKQHLEDLADRTSYFTTNLLIMDIKVRPFIAT